MASLVSEIFEMKLPDQLRTFETSLENAKLSEIAQHISLLGYNAERIDEGLAKNSAAKELDFAQQKEYGEQYSATAERDRLKAEADKRVSITWKIAKMAITDMAIQKTLGIHQNRLHSLNGWMKQSERFYRNITPQVMTYMAEYAYTDEKILEEKNMVDAVIAADKKQVDETGDAQRATLVRDEAVDDLHAWMKKFYKVAKLALKEEPQLLEKLGVLDRS